MYAPQYACPPGKSYYPDSRACQTPSGAPGSYPVPDTEENPTYICNGGDTFDGNMCVPPQPQPPNNLPGWAGGQPQPPNNIPGWAGGQPQPQPTPPPAPPPPPELTSISISVYPPDEKYGGSGIKRVYKVNEGLDESKPYNFGWYVNGTRVSSGRGYNFKGNAGDKIYAVFAPDKAGTSGTMTDTGANFSTGAVRSNTIVYNPSGADGAGEAGTNKPVDTDGDGIPNDEDKDKDGDGIPDDQDDDMDGDGIPDKNDDDIDGDGIPNEEDDDIDGDGIPNDKDPTPGGNYNTIYDTLYTRASQAQYLGDVFHKDPTHDAPPPKEEGFSVPTPLLIMAGLAGAFLLYNNRKR